MNDDQLRKKIAVEIERAVRGVRPQARRREIIVELESHFFEAYAEEISNGKVPNEAFSTAVLKIGELESVGSDFERIYPPFYRQPYFWFGAVTFILTSIVPLSIVTASREYSRRSEQREEMIDRKIDEMIADQSPLASVFAQDSKRVVPGKNFGLFANHRISWETAPAGQYPPTAPDSIDPPRDMLERIQSANVDGWLDLVHQPSLYTKIPTKWMRDLETYDYWEVFHSSPVERELLTSPVQGFSISIPNYGRLVAMAKIRYLQGIRSRQVLPALREVRNLARLISTNEIIVGNLVAFSMLSTERTVYDYAVSNGLLAPDAWRPFSKAGDTRTKLALYASVDLFDVLRERPSRWDRLLSTRPPGLCAALTEALIRSGISRSLIQGSWPFEKDYSSTTARIESILATQSHGCRLLAGRAAWTRYSREIDPSSFVMGYLEDLPWGYRFLVVASRLPYVRRLAAEAVNGVVTPNVLRYWKNEFASPSSPR